LVLLGFIEEELVLEGGWGRRQGAGWGVEGAHWAGLLALCFKV